MRYSGSVVGVSLSAMVPCLAVLKSIHMYHCPIADVIQTIRTLLSGLGTPPLHQSATRPLLSLKHMGNYMPVGRRVKIGSDRPNSSAAAFWGHMRLKIAPCLVSPDRL